MPYIYHRVPKDMRGDVLFPLNILKETQPDLYEKKSSKYVGREELLEYKLPVLNCLWNDVLHFSAVHPSSIKQALADVSGVKPLDVEFFEIDSHLLNSDSTIVYLYKEDKMADRYDEASFVTYNPDVVAEYSLIPQETKDHYKEKLSQDKKPLIFYRIPHILFKGSLDISKVKRIVW